ncbi:MAG TPA: hypothetical protein VFW19_07020 [Allosphingosinicella sp.]|nr:hypothetical protein [Allosphingosinicella sp.]
METIEYFREQAAQCRRLAGDMAASFERHGLLQLASHYDAEARRAALDAIPKPDLPARRSEPGRPRVFG